MSDSPTQDPSRGEAKGIDNYFESYEDIEIHRLMVGDTPRTQAYYDAIMKNKHLFDGKICMDVGAGTGILSLFMAQAGAKKVYAVEASKIAALIPQVASDNKFSDIITAIQDRVEAITLPTKVDVIVSEWMGFYLLHESMLNSVIYARDHLLADSGILFPSEARIYACPCSLSNLYHQIQFWDNVFGFNVSAVSKYALGQKSSKPEVQLVSEDDLLASPVLLKTLNLRWVTEEELSLLSSTSFTGVTKEGRYQGLCLWFEVDFDGREYDLEGSEIGELVTLSTSPTAPPTHWKQTVIVFGLDCDQEKELEVDITSNNSKIGPELYKKATTTEVEGGGEEGLDDLPSRLENVDVSTEEKKVNERVQGADVKCKHKNLGESNEVAEGTDVRIRSLVEQSKDLAGVDQPSSLVEPDEVVGWRLTMIQSPENIRHYTISFEMLDPETEEHEMGCECPMARCMIIKKMLEKELELEEEDEVIDCT